MNKQKIIEQLHVSHLILFNFFDFCRKKAARKFQTCTVLRPNKRPLDDDVQLYSDQKHSKKGVFDGKSQQAVD